MDEVLESREGRAKFVRAVSAGTGDFAIAEGENIFLIWYKTPWYRMGGADQVAIHLALLKEQNRVPKWLEGSEAIANIMLGNFEVETFPGCPGCLVIFCADLEAKRKVETSKRAAMSSAGKCPKCGFTYKWNGKQCGHCGYSSGSDEEKSAP